MTFVLHKRNETKTHLWWGYRWWLGEAERQEGCLVMYSKEYISIPHPIFSNNHAPLNLLCFFLYLINLPCSLLNILMSSKNHSHFILFLLCLFDLSLTVYPSKGDTETGYKEWVSWNAKTYKRTILKSESSAQALAGHVSSLDSKLRNAELNKVRLSVNQDGTGDYKSIRNALDSIPLHNSRRVILDIKPGIYRYIFTLLLFPSFSLSSSKV